MLSLTEVISRPERLRAVVQDATVMLDEEVASKGGLSGMGIKAAYGVVKALKPGIIPEVFASLLPEFSANLDPLLARRAEGSSAAVHFEKHSNEVVQALLAVTDKRAQKTTHKTLVSAYEKLRPTAEKHISAAVPRLGRLVEKHLAAAATAP
jgi:hypothetical protein